MTPEKRSNAIDRAAEAAHETNLVYCLTIGDHSQVPWSMAPRWQKDSARKGVEHAIAHGIDPGGLHESWLAEKRELGWKYGEKKDMELRIHPCFLPYVSNESNHGRFVELKGVVSLVGGVRDGETISAAVERWHKDKCQRLEQKLKNAILELHAKSVNTAKPSVCQTLPKIDIPVRAEVVEDLQLTVVAMESRLTKLEAMPPMVVPVGIECHHGPHGAGDIRLEVTEKK